VTRLLPGALGNEASTENESFSGGWRWPMASGEQGNPQNAKTLLDYPHYTRPADFRGWKVPEVLISGHHAEVAKWRKEQGQRKTRQNRPDLLREIS